MLIHPRRESPGLFYYKFTLVLYCSVCNVVHAHSYALLLSWCSMCPVPSLIITITITTIIFVAIAVLHPTIDAAPPSFTPSDRIISESSVVVGDCWWWL